MSYLDASSFNLPPVLRHEVAPFGGSLGTKAISLPVSVT